MLNPKNRVKCVNVLVLKGLMTVYLSQRLSMESRASLFLGKKISVFISITANIKLNISPGMSN